MGYILQFRNMHALWKLRAITKSGPEKRTQKTKSGIGGTNGHAVCSCCRQTSLPPWEGVL